MRCFFLFVVLLALSPTVDAQSPADAGLTESEAVQRGLQRPDIVQSLGARREAATGREQAAGRWANPEVEFSSEGADLPGGRVDDRFLWVRQRFNLAGVHGLERDAAGSARVAEFARTDFRRREVAAEIRRFYYEAVAAEREARAVGRWRQRLAELSRAVSNRANAGDASRFDALRLQQELALVAGDATTARARAESARDRLFSLIGMEPVPLEDDLLPPASNTTVASVVQEHPMLEALEAEARSARLASEAADRRSWPELTVGVGQRTLDEPGVSADGNLLSLGVTVPLFSNGSGQARAASAQSRRLSAERDLLASRLGADARSLIRELEARRSAAIELIETRPETSLASIAEAAYEAGEISVVELIDAHRTELSVQREADRRALMARQSFIELQMMRGES